MALFLGAILACGASHFAATDGGPPDADAAQLDASDDHKIGVKSDAASGDAAPADASSDADAAAADAGAGPRRVFVTNANFDGGVFLSLAGADAVCNGTAADAGLGGQWVAWLSDTKTDMTTRLGTSGGPFKLLDGTIVANDWTELTSGKLQAPINLTETQATVSKLTWTGTAINGQTAGDSCTTKTVTTCVCVDGGACYTCNDWSGTGGVGAAGNTNCGADSCWTANGNGVCAGNTSGSSVAGLYCFEK